MFRTNPKFFKTAELCASFTNETKINLNIPQALAVGERFMKLESERAIKSIDAVTPIPQNIIDLLKNESNADYVQNDEGFINIFDGETVKIYADTQGGIQNGFMTFLQSLDNGCYKDEILWDYPISSIRGVKVMMPGPDEIKEFKEFIDMMTFFRHNVLMIEIGAAMEYKAHPEINEGWVEYCEFMSEYSGKTKKLQEFTYPWRKNSIHCNNGGGTYLSQEVVRDIVQFCSDRNVEIIPEMPSTCHCDYLLIRHPELAERCEDPYPDTFCPSNPDSYKLLFELFDEVIDVFKPNIMNIGHDEYYSINVCDRCRKRIISNADLLAEDINTIYDYLASKNVKTMLWCDKLMNIEEHQGHGGALNYVHFAWNPNDVLLNIVRPTWEARNKIPKDIICLNWYLGFGEKYDDEIKDFPVVFGNFSAYSKGIKNRCGGRSMGGICSNWGAATDEYFQLNNVFSGFVFNEIYYWDSEFSDDDFKSKIGRVFESLYAYHYSELKKQNKAIEVIHTTTKHAYHRSFVDGVFPHGEEYHNTYYTGDYVISYTDGTVERTPIYYGRQIVNQNVPWVSEFEELERLASDDNPNAAKTRITVDLTQLAYSNIPMYIDGKVFCKTVIENKHPEKEISDIKFEVPEDKEWKVEVYSIEK